MECQLSNESVESLTYEFKEAMLSVLHLNKKVTVLSTRHKNKKCLCWVLDIRTKSGNVEYWPYEQKVAMLSKNKKWLCWVLDIRTKSAYVEY